MAPPIWVERQPHLTSRPRPAPSTAPSAAFRTPSSPRSPGHNLASTSITPHLLIRRAEVADADAIGRVHVTAWQAAYRGLVPDDVLASLDATARAEQWRNALASSGESGVASFDDDKATVLVAEDPSGNVVGIAAVGRHRGSADPTVGELWMMNLAPAAWGRDIAPPLLRAAEKGLRDLGFSAAVLWVAEGNGRARRFYEREGWTLDGAVKTQTPSGLALRQVCYRRALR